MFYKMKPLIILFVLILMVACNHRSDPSPNPAAGENVAILVQPIQTDQRYASNEQSHYVIRSSNARLNKLLLFIGGSFSIPKDYSLFCNHSASIGLDVVSRSYPNDVATAPLGSSSDMLVFDHYRQELCFGTPVSSAVTIDTLHSVNMRAIKLVQYLTITYPEQHWGQYLTTQNTLKWDKVIVAGHSQGSGHACYLAKKNLTDRVVMFSGPNDYSSYFVHAAHWLRQPGVTPTGKHFALLHLQDEVVPFNHQVINLQGLGLLGAGQNPLQADNLVSPYSNKTALSINTPAISYHSSTVGGNAKLPAIWTYMLTSH